MKTLSSPLFLSLFFLWTGVFAAEKIDINTAPIEELVKIIHIGEVRAKELISLRPFYSVDELDRIKGIGPSRLADIKAQGLAWVDPALQQTPQPQPQPEPQQESQAESQIVQRPEQESRQTTELQEPSSTPPAQSTQQLKEQEPARIDINTASVQELQKLESVGQVLAQRIIDARPFYSVDELTKVRGIGSKTLQDIKSQGLAWVDSALQPPKIEEEAEPLERGSAQAAQPLKPLTAAGKESALKPHSVLLMALTLAIFSGAIILIFKNKLKKEL